MLRIGNIQRFSVDDGPGIRTTVFLKGCNLRCAWCHNPENLAVGTALEFDEKVCVLCGKCGMVCRAGVHQFSSVDGHVLRREKCNGCGACCKVCPAGALRLIGSEMPCDTLLALLEQDKDYYDTSGGGVTFSGGEPLLQAQNLGEMLRLCKEKGIHTAVDTAGCVPYESFQIILPFTSLFLYDVKLIDSKRHRRFTAAENRRILDNLSLLLRDQANLIVRTPFIEGVNTSKPDVEALADFLSGQKGILKHQILPYHDYGLGKYAMLGISSGDFAFQPPSKGRMAQICQYLIDRDVPAEIG